MHKQGWFSEKLRTKQCSCAKMILYTGCWKIRQKVAKMMLKIEWNATKKYTTDMSMCLFYLIERSLRHGWDKAGRIPKKKNDWVAGEES